jgi:hypothetical protein
VYSGRSRLPVSVLFSATSPSTQLSPASNLLQDSSWLQDRANVGRQDFNDTSASCNTWEQGSSHPTPVGVYSLICDSNEENFRRLKEFPPHSVESGDTTGVQGQGCHLRPLCLRPHKDRKKSDLVRYLLSQGHWNGVNPHSTCPPFPLSQDIRDWNVPSHVPGHHFTRGLHPGNVLAELPSLSCISAEICWSILSPVICGRSDNVDSRIFQTIAIQCIFMPAATALAILSCVSFFQEETWCNHHAGGDTRRSHKEITRRLYLRCRSKELKSNEGEMCLYIPRRKQL